MSTAATVKESIELGIEQARRNEGSLLETANGTALATQPHLIPQPGGRGALLSGGMPGNKGGGDHPDVFRARMRELASSGNVEEGLRALLSDPKTAKPFLGAVKHVTEHGYGKPTEKHELSGDAKVTVNVVYSHE